MGKKALGSSPFGDSGPFKGMDKGEGDVQVTSVFSIKQIWLKPDEVEHAGWYWLREPDFNDTIIEVEFRFEQLVVTRWCPSKRVTDYEGCLFQQVRPPDDDLNYTLEQNHEV